MAKVYFRGFVLPRFISDLKVGPLVWREPTLGDLQLRFAVQGHIIAAECDIDGDVEDTNRITLLHIWVFHLIRGYLDAISFTSGLGLTLILNQFFGPDRMEKQLVSRFDDLAALCTFKPEELFALTERERGILKHIHDLVDSLINPMESLFLCGRAVEGFRRLMLPDPSIRKQWEFMRDNLNFSQDYLTFITNKSTGSRHGDLQPAMIGELYEVRKRAWIVANRFLEFRKRNNVGLSRTEFPVL